MTVGRKVSLDENGDPCATPTSSLVGSHEEASNRALSNIIRQLASLGKHAKDIFGEIDTKTNIESS